MFFIYKMPACRKIIAKKVADKCNQQQRGCSLSRKWSHTRSRCKIDAVYFPSAQHHNVERRLKPRVPLLPFKHRAVGSDIGDIKVESERSRIAAFLRRCIFNLAMNEVLHRLSKYDCRWRYAMQPTNGSWREDLSSTN